MAIGRALALQGATVLLVDLDSVALVQTATELRTPAQSSVWNHLRTCAIAGVERLIAAIDEEYGRIDILVNNAGIHRRGTPTQYDPQDLATCLP